MPQRQTPSIGCIPYNLPVKTGQTFYITVAVTDTVDLFAWQIDARYYPEYLEFAGIVSGDHLRSDGAFGYSIAPVIVPDTTINDMTLAAYTRLGKDYGTDGGGKSPIFCSGQSNRSWMAQQSRCMTSCWLTATRWRSRNPQQTAENVKIIISDAAPQFGPRVYTADYSQVAGR